jgi:hypothetical protein
MGSDATRQNGAMVFRYVGNGRRRLTMGGWMMSNDHYVVEDLIDENAQLKAELDSWREGGLTEDILRRHDGYIKVGKGCVIVREEEYAQLKIDCDTWTQKYRELDKANELLKAEVWKLQQWYDVMFGIPNEEIRHAQQVEALEAERDQLKAKLKEMGT